ncbi:MAG TPA: hypothetical protein VNS09_06015 [Solirubrobacter sp.]|nr:hypothetical protein [Solirubrobacter sp.]
MSPRTRSGPLVTLACAPRDSWSTGLLQLGFALAERDCRVAYLGPRVSAAALSAIAERTSSALIVLSAEAHDLTRRECVQLRLIRCPLVVVGAAREELARALRVSAAGPDPVRAAADIARTARTARVSPR